MFRKKVDTSGMPTMSDLEVVGELEDGILIHEGWAVKVTQEPKYTIYYLQGGK